MHHLRVEQPPDEHVAQPRVGELLQPAGTGAVAWGGRQQGVSRVRLVDIGADHRGVGNDEVAVDQHRDSPERAQPLELVIAVEGRDRVDFIVEALQFEAGEHLAHIRADEAADDLHVAKMRPRPACVKGSAKKWMPDEDSNLD
jgi:hypothetical protein